MIRNPIRGSFAGIVALAGLASGQSFNVDVGVNLNSTPPTNAYGAAAGQTGFWNEYDVTTTATLNDLAGNPTAVQLSKVGGLSNYWWDNPATSGDDEALMDCIQDCGNLPGIKSDFTLTGLANGDYTVYIYAWTPYGTNQNFTRTRIIGGNAGNQVVGGDWPGSHVNLVTYAVDTITVTTNTMTIRALSEAGWGSVNGFQVILNGVGCQSNAVNYCTAGTSASGCQATLSAVGAASTSGSGTFTVSASGVEGDKDGIYFQGTNGRQANPWGNGTSFQCVVPPVKRLGLLGKSGTSGACDGSFSQELNAFWQANPTKNPGAGTLVQFQCWYRDPANTSNQTTSLSDALEFSVCP